MDGLGELIRMKTTGQIKKLIATWIISRTHERKEEETSDLAAARLTKAEDGEEAEAEAIVRVSIELKIEVSGHNSD